MGLSQCSDWAAGWAAGVWFPAEAGIVFFVIASRSALGSTQPPFHGGKAAGA